MAARRKSKIVPQRRPVVYTAEVLAAIPTWVDLGASLADIAAALGTTVGSLRVKCSHANISLSTSPLQGIASLNETHWGALRREALRRGLTVPRLIAEIVRCVAERDAFSDVLGRHGSTPTAGVSRCAGLS